MGELLPCTCLPGLVGARDPREGREESLASTGLSVPKEGDTQINEMNRSILSFLWGDLAAAAASDLPCAVQEGF